MVIFGSIAYYLIVVWSEIVVKIAPSLSCTFNTKKKVPDTEADDFELADLAGISSAAARGSVFRVGDRKGSVMLGEPELVENPMMSSNPMFNQNVTVTEDNRSSFAGVEDVVTLKDTIAQLQDEIASLKKKNAEGRTLDNPVARKTVKKKKKTIDLQPTQIYDNELDGL